MKKILKNGTIIDALFWAAGCFIYATAVTVLLGPNEISPGGFTGISTVFNSLFGIPAGAVLIVLNIPVFIIQKKVFGSGSIVKTAAATVLLSVFLDLTEQLLPKYHLDGILASVFGGILSGLGLSLVMLRGATTGGADVIAKLINKKYRHFPVGRAIMFFDFAVIVLTALVYRNVESAMYSVITIYASSKVIDTMLYGGNRGKIVYIITSNEREVSAAIFSALRRGVTKINVTGGFTGEKRHMLMCAVRIHEVAAVLRAVNSADPNSFTVIAEAGEIIGEGFRRNS